MLLLIFMILFLSGDWIEYAGRRDTAYSIPLNSKYYNGYYKIELAPLKMY